MSWLTDTAMTTGVLIALVLVLRRPAARMFGPGLAYALWALPVLRLLLPPVILPAEAVPAEVPPTMVVLAADQALTAAPPAPAWSTLAPMLQAVWLGGALAFLAWRCWSYRAMRARLLAGSRPVGEAGKVRLVESPTVTSPIAFGLRDKVVALPLGFMNQNDLQGRDLAIAHELEHHAGRDLLANMAMQPLLALHWFNPLAWVGWQAMRRDQEAACDARVLVGRDGRVRETYARLIASFAAGPRLALAAPMACPVIREKSIVYRLRSLTMSQPSPRQLWIGRLLLGSGVLALPLTATISHAQQEAPEAPAAAASADAPGGSHKIRKVVIVEGASPHDPKLQTRVVTRGANTYEFRTVKPLSQAEAEARVDQIEKGWSVEGGTMTVSTEAAPGQPHQIRQVVVVTGGSIGQGGPELGEAPMPPEPPVAPGAPQPIRVHNVMLHADGVDAVAPVAAPAAVSAHCPNGKPIVAHAERKVGNKREVSQIVLCSADEDSPAAALAGLRKARDRVATDTHISPEVKAEVLREMDAQIADLEKLS